MLITRKKACLCAGGRRKELGGTVTRRAFLHFQIYHKTMVGWGRRRRKIHKACWIFKAGAEQANQKMTMNVARS